MPIHRAGHDAPRYRAHSDRMTQRHAAQQKSPHRGPACSWSRREWRAGIALAGPALAGQVRVGEKGNQGGHRSGSLGVLGIGGDREQALCPERFSATPKLNQSLASAKARLATASSKPANSRLIDTGGLGHRVLRNAIAGEMLYEVFPHG